MVGTQDAMAQTTRAKVASIASIILIILVASIAFIIIINQWSIIWVSDVPARSSASTVFGSSVAMTLSFASHAIITFLHKLGLQRSRFHDIVQWTAFVFEGVFLFLYLMTCLGYQRSSWFYLFLPFVVGMQFIRWIWSVVTTFMEILGTASYFSPGAHLDSGIPGHQQPKFFYTPTKGGIWYVFIYAIVMAIFSSVLIILPSVSLEGTSILMCAAVTFIHAMLAVSTWIVATAPLSPLDIEDPLAPQDEGTEATRNVGNMIMV